MHPGAHEPHVASNCWHWTTAGLPNALTGLRVVLTPVFTAAVCIGGTATGAMAVGVFALIAASDVLDGWAARRYAAASRAGRTFDHFADICFLTAALSTYALLGSIPWWVPAAVTGSFCVYVIDSWSRTETHAAGLIGSRVGHAAGVLNYTLVGILVCNNTAGIGLLSAHTVWVMSWLVPMYSALAVITRFAGRAQKSAR